MLQYIYHFLGLQDPTEIQTTICLIFACGNFSAFAFTIIKYVIKPFEVLVFGKGRS